MDQKIRLERRPRKDSLDQNLEKWEDLKSRLDPDRKSLFRKILGEVKKYRKFIDKFRAEDKAEAALMSMIIEMRRDLEDVRNQLELERARNTASELPMPGAV
ncbi:MAG: hypothetical protein SVV03_05980 [Candidatus Nanohaloarchaea archaeon]|nr:hypothetical protein [Candidatus Nanohaloarchaea archaeon]